MMFQLGPSVIEPTKINRFCQSSHRSVLEYLKFGDDTLIEFVQKEYNPKVELLDAKVAGNDAEQNSG
jgi:hypothetical protein